MTEIEVYAHSAMSNIPTKILWVLLVVLIVGSCSLLWLKGWQDGKYSIARLILVEWIVLVFCTTIVFRNTRVESAINLIPFSSYFCIAENSYLKEVAVINLLNVVMFVPVGVLLKCAFINNTWKQAILAGSILSTTIELSQFILSRGLCEVDDVIHNVLGCMLGYMLKRFLNYV